MVFRFAHLNFLGWLCVLLRLHQANESLHVFRRDARVLQGLKLGFRIQLGDLGVNGWLLTGGGRPVLVDLTIRKLGAATEKRRALAPVLFLDCYFAQ